MGLWGLLGRVGLVGLERYRRRGRRPPAALDVDALDPEHLPDAVVDLSKLHDVVGGLVLVGLAVAVGGLLVAEEAGMGVAEEVLPRHVHDGLDPLHVEAAVQEGPQVAHLEEVPLAVGELEERRQGLRAALEDKVPEVISGITVLDGFLVGLAGRPWDLWEWDLALFGPDEGLVVRDAVPLAVLAVEVGQDAAEVLLHVLVLLGEVGGHVASVVVEEGVRPVGEEVADGPGAAADERLVERPRACKN